MPKGGELGRWEVGSLDRDVVVARWEESRVGSGGAEAGGHSSKWAGENGEQSWVRGDGAKPPSQGWAPGLHSWTLGLIC